MTPAEIRDWLISRIARTLRIDPSTVDVHQSFDGFGLSSSDAVSLAGELEETLGRDLPATLIYEYPSIEVLAQHLGDGRPVSGAAGHGSIDCDDAGRIAIVGIGCRFPGAPDPSAYWRLLCGGVDAVREVPADRWKSADVYDADASVPGKAVSRWGGFLDQVDQFDPFFFGISPGEAERMDPQQRLLLELAFEAFEDAGYPTERLAGFGTGVFVGICVNEYGFLQHGRPDLINGHTGTGNALSVAANRISYFFDLHGPSIAVDTACSSSLVAVHLACRSLRTGECDLALAGGVNVVLSPAHSIAFTKAGVLARDGRCKVFDAEADGYVRGEGAGLVVLKPLARAVADGDTIYAVIRGSAVRQDGRTNGLMAPSRDAQEAVLRDACRDALVSPGDVQYVEAHGTGTLLGDSIEARALGAVFASRRSNGPCAIGSVKSNLGHLEAAAGIAALIKVALALRHRTIPPSIHFRTPNPHVPFAELELTVQRELTPWPGSAGPALAGVSSFGFGGTIAHAVLQEPPDSVAGRSANGELTENRRAQLLPLSAHSPDALVALAGRYRETLADPSNEGVALADVCRSAGLDRNHLDCRAGIVTDSKEEMIAGLDGLLGGASLPNLVAGRPGHPPRRLAFVFSGQGSQWTGMARELLRGDPAFKTQLDRCEAALRQHVDWSLQDLLLDEAHSGRLEEIDVIQPVLFALQVALADLWRQWGVEPDAVVGHSVGEVAAACVAGALTLEDAARVVCARSRALKRLSGRGGMAVVGLSAEETARWLRGRERQLAIAAINSPRSTVVAGDTTALVGLIAELERDDIFCARVNVDVASHSPQTAPLREELCRCLDGLVPRRPALPLVSTVTGSVCDAMPLDADYWARNVTEPVDFSGAMDVLLDEGYDTFIEISPHPVLQTSIQQSLIHHGAPGSALASLRRGEGERSCMLRSLGALYASGRRIAWERVHPVRGRRVPLPLYPWQRKRFWMNGATADGSSADADGARPALGDHPMLGPRLVLAHPPGAAVWQSLLDPSSLPFLRDHRIGGEVVMPAAGFVEMALSAASEAGIADTHDLDDLQLRQRLAFPDGQPRLVQVALAPESEGAFSWSLHSRERGTGPEDWTLHATANLMVRAEPRSPPAEPLSISLLRAACKDRLDPAEFYRALAGRGLEYGPSLQGIREVVRREGEALGRIEPRDLDDGLDRYRVHPALLDAAFQLVAAAITGSDGESAERSSYLPVGCHRIVVYRSPGRAAWCHIHLGGPASSGDRTIKADVRLLDESGGCVMNITGFRLARVANEPVRAPSPVEDIWRYRVIWRPAPWPPGADVPPTPRADARHWVIFADRLGIADNLARQLEASGHRCRLVPCDDVAGRALDGGGTADGAWDQATQDAVEAALEAEGSPLAGVIHLWGCGRVPAEATSLASVHESQRIGCHAVVCTIQSLLARSGVLGIPRLWLITCGTQAVGAGDRVSVGSSSMWGLGKTVGFELPDLRSTLVDLDPDLDPATLASQLYRQLCVDDEEDQVALRGEDRLVPRLVTYTPPPVDACSADPIRADTTYLITGGLGGLGLAVATWMVDRGARHVVLVGRGAPSTGALATIERMRRHEADVAVRSVDVSSDSQVGALIEEVRRTMPPLRGIVHAAGVLENAPVADLERGALERVLAPKVLGAWNLHEATRAEPLDFFVMFSSAVSVLGSPGQGNYAAANSFLDALAHDRRGMQLPALSINWGPWAEIGLVADGVLAAPTDAGASGVKGIQPARGLDVLGRALRDDAPQFVVLPFDLRSLLDLYPAAAKIPFFAEVIGEDPPASRLYARPDLRQEYVAPRNELEHRLVDLWRQTLRIDRVGVRDSFFELGGDSVLGAQIITAVHRSFGVTIDPREAFEAFTIEHLAQRVEAALIARIDELSEAEAEQLLQEHGS